MADLGMAVVLTGEQQTKTGIAAIREETKKLMEATTGVSGSFRSAAESASAFTSSLRTIAEAENALHVAAQNQITDLKAQKSALQDVGYRKAQAEIKALQEELNPSKVQTFSQTWQELASKYYLVSQAAQSAGRVVMSLVEAASKYELLQARLTSVEGSSALGMRDFKEVQELAKKPGLGFEEAASTFATLRGMKVTAAEAKTLINGIAQANASAAGTAEQFGRVMYQIQQSVSLGRLMAEDLRPIVQQIPTLGAAINNTFGTTDAEALNKRLKESGKSVRDFWLEVAGLGKNLPAASDTIQNNLDNMGDGWVRLKAAMTNNDAIKGATAAMANLLVKIAEFLEADKEVERSYIVRTKVIEKTQKEEASKYGGQSPVALPAGLLHVDTAITNSIIRQGQAIKKAQEDSLQGVKSQTSLWGDALADYNKGVNALAKSKDEQDKKDRDRLKSPGADKAAESLKAQLARHDKASAANVVFSGANEVTMRDGMSWSGDGHIAGGNEDEQAKGIERREEGRRKAEQKKLADEKKLHEEVIKISKDRIEENQKLEANAQKIRMDWESALIEKKRQAHEEEMKLIRERFDVGQKLASDQVYKMLQGEFTIRGAVNATKDVMFRAFADTTTKWIEEQLIKMIFAKGAQAEETASAVAQASTVGAAWAAPSMATSIATFGGSTATGSAAWFTAMTAAQGYSVMPHARGGAVFGPVNASREESFAPFVPGRIIPSYNSTTNHNTTNAQSITIHVHGGDEKTILRTLRKAGINGAGVSRS